MIGEMRMILEMRNIQLLLLCHIKKKGREKKRKRRKYDSSHIHPTTYNYTYHHHPLEIRFIQDATAWRHTKSQYKLQFSSMSFTLTLLTTFLLFFSLLLFL